MKFSDLRNGDILHLIYHNYTEEPIQLYTWVQSKDENSFYATDLWSSLGEAYLDTKWELTPNNTDYELLVIIGNTTPPLKLLQDLCPELFI